MSYGPFTWFDPALLKINQDVFLGSDSLKCALCGDAQVLSASFVGASGDCRYADLTDQLATALGYTSGGQALTNVSLTRSGNRVTFTSDPIDFLLTGTISFKYFVFYDDTTANKDLVGFVDAETLGGELSAILGHLIMAPTVDGWGYWERQV